MECVFIGPLPSTGHGADHIENTSSNTFSIVAFAYFGRCLEMGLHVTILEVFYIVTCGLSLRDLRVCIELCVTSQT
jgi:hypothetical protein